MSDVSNARIDYPHIPRPLLEMLDFYSASSIPFPYPKDGKREAVVAMLVLIGGFATPHESNGKWCTRVYQHRGPDLSTNILLGNKALYMENTNKFFKEKTDGIN